VKKIGLYLLVCIFLIVPVAKVFEYSVSAYQLISDELLLFKSLDMSGKGNGYNAPEERDEAMLGILQALEAMIVMYNRVVLLLTSALLVVIGLALWKYKP